jgi:hypothetical protein
MKDDFQQAKFRHNNQRKDPMTDAKQVHFEEASKSILKNSSYKPKLRFISRY